MRTISDKDGKRSGGVSLGISGVAGDILCLRNLHVRISDKVVKTTSVLNVVFFCLLCYN